MREQSRAVKRAEWREAQEETEDTRNRKLLLANVIQILSNSLQGKSDGKGSKGYDDATPEDTKDQILNIASKVHTTPAEKVPENLVAASKFQSAQAFSIKL